MGTENYNIVSIKSFLQEMEEATISAEQMRDLEKFGDSLLNRYGIDIEFTRHFGERLNDTRNKPMIEVFEIRDLFKKIEKDHAEKIKKIDDEAVLVDMQSKLNLPFVIKIRNGKIGVFLKTIMRKSNFLTPDEKIRY